MENFVYLIPVFGLIGLVFTAIKSSWVTKQVQKQHQKLQKILLEKSLIKLNMYIKQNLMLEDHL